MNQCGVKITSVKFNTELISVPPERSKPGALYYMAIVAGDSTSNHATGNPL